MKTSHTYRFYSNLKISLFVWRHTHIMSFAIHTALQAALAAAAATYLLYKRVTTNDRSQVSDMTAIGFYQTSTLRIYSFHSRSFIIGYYLSVGFIFVYRLSSTVLFYRFSSFHLSYYLSSRPFFLSRMTTTSTISFSFAAVTVRLPSTISTERSVRYLPLTV